MLKNTVLCIYFIGVTAGQTVRNNLLNNIFTNYDFSVRSFCGTNDVTNSSIDIAIRQLIDLDEPSQILKMNVWIRLRWYDCQLTWTPSNYSNIDHLVVPYKRVWIPDIVLFDSLVGQFDGIEDYRPVLYSDGHVHFNFPTLLECSCDVNVRFFPFDTQSCVLDFGSWVYNGFELDIFSKNPAGELSATKSNSEWIFLSFNAERTVTYFGCCPEPFPVITYTLKLERKSLYYVVNLFFPTIVIALIGVFAFILPVDSGEKIGLEVTVLLSLAVFLLVIGDALPPSSDNFPLIGYYFAFTMVVVGVATIMNVIILNLYYKSTNMPHWVRVVFLDKIGQIVLVHDGKKFQDGNEIKNIDKTIQEHEIKQIQSPRSSNTKVGRSSEKLFIKTHKIEPDVEENKEKIEKNSESTTTSDDWKTLSIILDRLSFIMYIVVIAIGSIAIFAPLSNSK